MVQLRGRRSCRPGGQGRRQPGQPDRVAQRLGRVRHRPDRGGQSLGDADRRDDLVVPTAEVDPGYELVGQPAQTFGGIERRGVGAHQYRAAVPPADPVFLTLVLAPDHRTLPVQGQPDQARGQPSLLRRW